MIAYRYEPDDRGNNIYKTIQYCQKDPIASKREGKDVFLLPASCTYTEPPEPREGFNRVWDGGKWDYMEAPKLEPAPPVEDYKPTKEDKINVLDAQYQADKRTLQSYYLEFTMAGNTEAAEEIKQELDDLAAQYDADWAALEAEEEG